MGQTGDFPAAYVLVRFARAKRRLFAVVPVPCSCRWCATLTAAAVRAALVDASAAIEAGRRQAFISLLRAVLTAPPRSAPAGIAVALQVVYARPVVRTGERVARVQLNLTRLPDKPRPRAIAGEPARAAGILRARASAEAGALCAAAAMAHPA